VEAQDPTSSQAARVYPSARVRDTLGVSQRTMDILHGAMLADVEDSEGTGTASRIPGFRVCGKTGTAQVMDEHNNVKDHTTWFASYGPFERPRYAVVVMIESGTSGGGTCAPVARDIYLALQQREKDLARPKAQTIAKAER
jgi:cell division protein FtsI/penicillin-binding protein 2